MLENYRFICRECGKSKTYLLEPADVNRWRNGELIQRVFPQIEDREIMISQTCSDYFDKLFAEEAEKEA
jgi:hypothetical protein